MSKKDEALKLALETLDVIDRADDDRDFLIPDECRQLCGAITAIRSALAESALERMAKNERELGLDYMVQPAQDKEPCGWRMKYNGEWAYSFTEDAWDFIRRVPKAQQQEPVAVYVGETWCGSVVRLYEDLPLETPLYTSPQPAQQEIEELTAQRDQLADILTRTANALKGQPAELSSHSWHDLPEVAQQIKAAQQQQEPVAYASDVEFDDETEIIPAEQKGKLGTAGLRIPLYIEPLASKPWVGLTDEDIGRCFDAADGTMGSLIAAIEAKLKEKNS